MAANKKLLMLPGDGIGPEVMKQVQTIIDWMDKRRHVSFDVTNDVVGGAAIDKYGQPLGDNTLADAMGVDAVLLGAVGGPKWDNVERDLRPEMGLLTLRKEMDLYANLRPATVLPAMAKASSLKEELVSGLDMLIVRELTGGVYFGKPRGIEKLADGTRKAVDTQVYSEAEIERVCRLAFELAGKRSGKVHSVEKANVMETGVLWRQIATEIGADFPDIDLHHMYADNCAMQLVRQPKQFDVIVTDNLFGDMLSDLAAMLTGSLGMLPSASLGAPMANGRPKALYEPVHGSAPDIAGQGKANPIACILSFAMALRYSFDAGEEADRLEASIETVLAEGLRTPDLLGEEGVAPVTTEGMGDAILAALEASL